MPEITRRNLLHAGFAVAAPCGIAVWLLGCQRSGSEAVHPSGGSKPDQLASQANTETFESNRQSVGEAMKVKFLEIVTPDVEGLCIQYAQTHGVTFSEPIANLGGARTATLDGGGMLSIRGPLRPDEKPTVRPYMLVDDLNAAVAAAAKSGAEVAIESMEIPDHGTIAIVIHGGIECGFWQA